MKGHAEGSDEKQRRLHAALALTWLAYGYFYVLRKALGTVKSALRHELAYSEEMLASLDTAFLAAYSGGLYASGCLVDSLPPRAVLSGGLLVAAAAAAMLPAVLPHGTSELDGGAASGVQGALRWAPAYACWFLHGLAQSTGHPAIQRILGRQLKGNRWSGMYLGIWTTSQTVGGMVGNFSGGMLVHNAGWEAALRCPGFLAPVVVCFLRYGWDALHVPCTLPGKRESTGGDHVDAEVGKAMPKPSWLRFLGGGCCGDLPLHVYIAAGAAFFVKFVRYALLFWLPYYNWAVLGYDASKAALHASVFEAGGFVGSMLIGPLSDRLSGSGTRKRALPSMLMMLGGAVVLGFVCPMVQDSETLTSASRDTLIGLAIFVVGISIDGPESVVTGAMCNDLCEDRQLSAVVGRVVGLVNGTGILGALIAGPAVTSWARWHRGWRSVFPFLAGVSVLGAVALLPLCGLGGAAAPRRRLLWLAALAALSLGGAAWSTRGAVAPSAQMALAAG